MLWLDDEPDYDPQRRIVSAIGLQQRQLDWSKSYVQALVSAWPMDEGTGAVCYDAMGVNNGTISGAAMRTVSRLGRSIQFLGSNSSVNVGVTQNVPTGTSERSISMDFISPDTTTCPFYIKPTSGQSFVINAGYLNPYYYIFTDGVNNVNNKYLIGSSIPTNNSKHTCVLTFKNSTLWYYLDGGLLYTTSLIINTGTVASILIGYYNNFNNNCTSNNVALFNKALTAAEVRDLYLNGLYIKEDNAYCLNTNQFQPWFVRPSSVWD